MRTSELISQIYQLSEKANLLFSYEVKGKTIIEWLLLGVKFSFIIWVGLLLWQGYNYYIKYQQIRREISYQEKILKQKKYHLAHLKRQLNEITIAYKNIAKIFSVKQVKWLKNKIDRAYSSLEEKNPKAVFTSVSYGGFNYRFQINRNIYSSLRSITLPEFHFKSKITNYFKNSLVNELRKSWLHQNVEKKGSIQISLKGSNLIMFFSSNGSTLNLKPISYVGFISDIYQSRSFLKASFIPFNALKNNLNYSQFYIGWDFFLK